MDFLSIISILDFKPSSVFVMHLKFGHLKKPIMFWEAPDNINAWHTLMRLKVDYINTDRISSLSNFLNKLPDNFLP